MISPITAASRPSTEPPRGLFIQSVTNEARGYNLTQLFFFFLQFANHIAKDLFFSVLLQILFYAFKNAILRRNL